MPRVVDHGERGVRIVVDEIDSGGIPDRRVQPPRHDHCRARVSRRVIGGERPPFADSFERCLVDERGGRGDVTLVPFEHLRGLDHEVAPEGVVTDLTRSGDNAVLWDVAHSWQQRTDQRQTINLRRTPRGHRLRVVCARRVTDDEVPSSADDLLGTHPHASLAVVDDAGHALPHEQPELLRALLAEWLARVGRAGP